MSGVGLSGPTFVEMHEVWTVESDRVEACVAEWWRKKERKPETGPGLLVRMVRDGDYPGKNGRRSRRAPSPPCPHCEVGGGEHTADCPTVTGASA
jgi:hypothetical protein